MVECFTFIECRSWHPLIVLQSIAGPSYKVLVSTAMPAGVDNVLNKIFLETLVSDNWLRFSHLVFGFSSPTHLSLFCSVILVLCSYGTHTNTTLFFGPCRWFQGRAATAYLMCAHTEQSKRVIRMAETFSALVPELFPISWLTQTSQSQSANWK